MADIAIVVSDDCGPDSTAAEELVRSYRDPRLMYVRNEQNLGLAGNWNRCLRVAPTDLVTIFHADDRLLPHYASMMLDAAECHQSSAAFYCDVTIINEASQPTFSFPDFYKKLIRKRAKDKGAVVLRGDGALASLMHGWYVMCPTICYRRSRLGPREFSGDWRMVVDVDFIASLLLDGEELIGLPHIAYQYRRHSANQTSVLTNELTRFVEESRIHDRLAAQATALGWEMTPGVAKAKRIIRFNLAYCIVRDLTALRPRYAGRKARLLGEMVWKKA